MTNSCIILAHLHDICWLHYLPHQSKHSTDTYTNTSQFLRLFCRGGQGVSGSKGPRLAGVGAEDAVDVGPDGDVTGAEERAHDCGGVVAAIAFERRHLSLRVLCDEARRHYHLRRAITPPTSVL